MKTIEPLTICCWSRTGRLVNLVAERVIDGMRKSWWVTGEDCRWEWGGWSREVSRLVDSRLNSFDQLGMFSKDDLQGVFGLHNVREWPGTNKGMIDSQRSHSGSELIKRNQLKWPEILIQSTHLNTHTNRWLLRLVKRVEIFWELKK